MSGVLSAPPGIPPICRWGATAPPSSVDPAARGESRTYESLAQLFPRRREARSAVAIQARRTGLPRPCGARN